MIIIGTSLLKKSNLGYKMEVKIISDTLCSCIGWNNHTEFLFHFHLQNESGCACIPGLSGTWCRSSQIK